MKFKLGLELEIADVDLLEAINGASNLTEDDEDYLSSLEGLTIDTLIDILPNNYFQEELEWADTSKLKVEIL